MWGHEYMKWYHICRSLLVFERSIFLPWAAITKAHFKPNKQLYQITGVAEVYLSTVGNSYRECSSLLEFCEQIYKRKLIAIQLNVQKDAQQITLKTKLQFSHVLNTLLGLSSVFFITKNHQLLTWLNHVVFTGQGAPCFVW